MNRIVPTEAGADLGRDLHGLVFGVETLLMGVLAVASVFVDLEFAVYAGGPLLALVALLYVGSRLRWRRGGTTLLPGGLVLALGVLLATHDYIFQPDVAVPVHFAVAVALVVVAGLQVASALRRPAPRRVPDAAAWG